MIQKYFYSSYEITGSGGSSEPNLPRVRIYSEADSDAGIDYDSGVDSEADGVDSGIGIDLGIAICSSNEIRIGISSGMRISSWIKIRSFRSEISPGISMRMDRLQVNFDSLWLSLRNIVVSKRLFL